MTLEEKFLVKLSKRYPGLKRPTGSSFSEDPRKTWIPYFRLVHEYPGVEGKLFIEVSPFGYTFNGVIPIVDHPENWPHYWQEI